MRTHLLPFAIALSVIAVAELGARGLQPHVPEAIVWDNRHTEAKAKGAAHRGVVDVAVVGSSIVNAGISPSRLASQLAWAESGYNAAVPGTPPRTWVLWTKEVVLPRLCPRLVVVGISPRDMNDANAGADRRFDEYQRSYGRREATTPPRLDRLRRWVREHSALFALRRRLRTPGKLMRHLLGRSTHDWKPLEFTGDGRHLAFDDRELNLDRARRYQERTGSFEGFRVGPKELGALRMLVQAARQGGSEVAFVELPYLRDELAALIPDGQAALASYHRELARTATDLGVPLLQHPEMMNDKRLFADYYHLNRAGSAKLSESTGAMLREHFASQPSRSERCSTASAGGS